MDGAVMRERFRSDGKGGVGNDLDCERDGCHHQNNRLRRRDRYIGNRSI
jgi:hypothetical protein